MRNELGEVRRSQVITSHGPGSLIDFRAGSHGGAGVSVVAAGLEEWDRWAPPPGIGNPQAIFEPRLQKQLGVEGFRLPPVAPQIAPGQHSPRAGKLVGVRYPRWLQCPRCHLIGETRRWAEDPGDPALYCAPCTDKAGGRNRVHAVPARFIVLCERGHLDEFPWEWWVNHREQCPPRHELELSGSATAGLAGLILRCLGCNAQRSMEGSFGPSAIPRQCQGRRPWLGTDADEPCSGTPRVVQRGASNIYFSVVESALDIPPWSDDLQKKIGMRWSMLEKAPDAAARRYIISITGLANLVDMTEDELAAAIEDRVMRLGSPDRNLRFEEYQQFVQHAAPFGENTEFEVRPSPPPPELSSWVQLVVRATRLREVRANRGFTRFFPPTPGDTSRVAQLSLTPLDWLPAVENRGEGIFLQLNLARVREWEQRQGVLERVSRLQQSYAEAWQRRGFGGVPPRTLTPRLFLIHSLSHALIRQLSLSCGYGSASLRERLYVDTGDWEMAGLLVFTSSPDADGTLGGLARQAESQNLVTLFEDCLSAMAWCSSDPLCSEGIHASTEPSNGSACHACMLASETSCEDFNSCLDRATLVGTAASPELGFFEDYLHELRG